MGREQCPYAVGEIWWDAYWHQEHTIIAVEPSPPETWMPWAVTARWADGRVTRHCTSPDKRDRRLA